MRKNNSKGITLTELLLAAGIMVFVLASLMVLFIHCFFLNNTNRNRSLALHHAQYILEEIRDADFATAEYSVTNGAWDWGQTEILANNLILLNGETIDTSVTQSGDPLGVMVTVNWLGSRGRPSLIHLRTLLTDF